MNHRPAGILAAALVVLAAATAGYWVGANRHPGSQGTASAQKEVASAPSAKRASSDGRRILYYRNPMGLPDTSPVPKKDSMGMDYIPVYEGEEPAGSGIAISPERIQTLGVATETAAPRDLGRPIRAVGTIGVDERLQHTVAPRFEGWIQRLIVNTTGEPVRPGQPLMEVYSPDLVAAQEEYLVAVRGAERLSGAGPEFQASMRSLVEGSLQRLRNWDIAEEELARLRSEGHAQNAVTLRSPARGVVIEKPSVQGMRFMPGEVLYRIADLSTVWLITEVFEQDLAQVRIGQSVRVRVNAFPERGFTGHVGFVYPLLNAETRTARVRIELPNPGQLLKPSMYADVEIAVQVRRALVAVPDSAIIDSGTRQVVFVRRAEGRFEPREVKLGVRGEQHVEVLDGVRAGEEVVVSANFLIDAESNLRSAVGGFGQPGGSSVAAPSPGSAHTAQGIVESVDAAAGTVSIAHQPVATLQWPAMTMEFKVNDRGLLQAIKPGARIAFDFRESAPGEWLIVRASPAGAGAARAPASAPVPAPAPADAHRGH